MEDVTTTTLVPVTSSPRPMANKISKQRAATLANKCNSQERPRKPLIPLLIHTLHTEATKHMSPCGILLWQHNRHKVAKAGHRHKDRLASSRSQRDSPAVT